MAYESNEPSAALRAALRAGHARYQRLEAADDARGLPAPQGGLLAAWRTERARLRRELAGLVGGRARGPARDAGDAGDAGDAAR